MRWRTPCQGEAAPRREARHDSAAAGDRLREAEDALALGEEEFIELVRGEEEFIPTPDPEFDSLLEALVEQSDDPARLLAELMFAEPEDHHTE